MSYDLLIRNGTIVDGTGKAAYRADVAIARGRIAEIGRVKDGASQTIDASDLVVAPGFIDPHTHYDAQICWDPMVTCSSWHGVTSVIMGNCGVGLAPCRPETREVAAWDLVNVEAIPFEILKRGVTWDWISFPDFMNAAQRRRSAINLGFFAPLTPFRHYVMGEESMERAASQAEMAQIRALIGEALAAGAMGLSTTNSSVHIGYRGRPLACRQASREELAAYCGTLRDLGRGVIQLVLLNAPGELSESELDLLTFLVDQSQRPVTWAALFHRNDRPESAAKAMRDASSLIRQRALPQVSCRPLVNQLNLRDPFVFGQMKCWLPAFQRPREEQKKLYRDRAFRQSFREELRTPRIFTGEWERLQVAHVKNPALGDLVGMTVANVARQRGSDPLDTFLDIAIEDNLDTEYMIELFNTDERQVEALINNPDTLLALSDGGAHVDALCDAGYCTYLLGHWVREKQAMSLEKAVKRLTSEPADYFGITSRGRVAEGMAADLAIFDPATVGSARRPTMVDDFPGGGQRMITQAQGVEHTIVNGRAIYSRQKPTGELAGEVLRSGRC
jgi:N-acyl-D-aspartate/D-glutamate deacylase